MQLNSIFLLVLYAYSVNSADLTPPGNFLDAALIVPVKDGWQLSKVDCAIVDNNGVDTIAVSLDSEGEVLRYSGTWRGSVGKYFVLPPLGTKRIELRAVSGYDLDPSLVRVTWCKESLSIHTIRAMSQALDLRIRGFFGEKVNLQRVERAFANAIRRISVESNSGWEADFFFEFGEWLRSIGRLDEASQYFLDSKRYFEEQDKALGVSDVSRSLGLVAWRNGEFELARQRFDDAIQSDDGATGVSSRVLDYRRAALLNNIGLLESEAGNSKSAIENFETALQIFQGKSDFRESLSTDDLPVLNDIFREALHAPSALNTLNNLALLYSELGNNFISERYFRNYLAFEPFIPEALANAQARHNLGVLMFEQGRLDEALRLLLDAKARFDSAGAGRWQAESRVALSLLYLELGDQGGAWAYAEQAMALEMDDRRARAGVLRQSGRIALELGHADAAFEAFQTAAMLLNGEVLPGELGALESDLARAEVAMGRLGAALSRQQRNVERLDHTEFLATAAQARSILGEILYQLDDRPAAIRSLQEAQQTQQRLGTRLAELETLERLGRIQQESDTQAAISTHTRALGLLADPSIRRLPEVRRAGFRARYRVLHERQIALLLDANRSDEAWIVGEWARTGDLMVLRDERHIGKQDSVRLEALDRHARLLAELHSLTSELDSDADEIQRVRAALDRLETDIQREFRDAPKPSPNVARDALRAHQRLLSFVLGANRGWVWVLGGPRDFVVVIDDVEGLRADVEQLLAQIRHPRNAIGRISRLVGAIRDRLPPQVHSAVAVADEVFIQPDRELHALPFALLWPDTDRGGSAPRVRRLVSATTAARPTAPSADPALLVLADPGWNEPGGAEPVYPEASLLTQLLRDSTLDRLPGTRREAEAIAELGGEGMRVQLKLGRAATRDFVLGGGMAGYPLLHVATHGLVDLEYPELSALLLADRDGAGPSFLRPADIARLDLNASLVVLSGCDTGYGRVYAGSGAFSLARPFLLAGAEQVLASLWKVDDHRTAQFMTRFYHHMLSESRPADQALMLTQQWMQRQPGNLHPYYWAGFILISESLSSAKNANAIQ